MARKTKGVLTEIPKSRMPPISASLRTQLVAFTRPHQKPLLNPLSYFRKQKPIIFNKAMELKKRGDGVKTSGFLTEGYELD